MKVKLGIRWYPRKVETIQQSLKSIGNVDLTIYPDFDSKLPVNGHNVVHLGGNVGCFKHYYRCLEHICDSDADIVAVFSDDMVYRRGWLNTAISKLTKDVGYVACYVPKGIQLRYRWRRGWHELNQPWDAAYGGGYIYRREIALKMLEHPFMINHRDNYKANQQIDHCIPSVAYKMGLKQLYYVPSLMNHIGITSTIGHVHTPMEKGAGW